MLTRKEIESYRLGRLLDTLSRPNNRRCFETDVGEAVAARAGKPFDSYSVPVPWQALARTMVAGTAASGGNLIGTGADDPTPALAPWSVVMRAGVTRMDGLNSDLQIPRAAAAPTTTWLQTETSTATVSEPDVTAVTLRPKTVSVVAKFSRQLQLQANATETFTRTVVLRAVASAIDAAVLTGAGTGGEPTGVLNSSSVGTQAGTSLGWSGVTSMLQSVAEANAEDSRIAYVGAPAIRKLLQGREVGTAGAGIVWANDGIAGRPSYVTSALGTDGLVCADWSQLVVGFFGPGLEVSVDPFGGFQSGVVAVRCIASIDCGLLTPAAFSISTGID